MGDSDFQPPGAPKPLNQSSWNLSWLILSSTRPHMQQLRHAALWVYGGVGVKLPHHVRFASNIQLCSISFVCVFLTVVVLTIKRLLSAILLDYLKYPHFCQKIVQFCLLHVIMPMLYWKCWLQWPLPFMFHWKLFEDFCWSVTVITVCNSASGDCWVVPKNQLLKSLAPTPKIVPSGKLLHNTKF